MQKQITITLDEEVYENLRQQVGLDYIGQFIEAHLRPRTKDEALDEGYRLMATDTDREREALAWAEGTVEDLGDEAR